MSNDDVEDDYLSDKFLLGDSTSNSKTKTYTELRKEALRASEAKSAAGRKKSKREVIEEGLATSLFEKAREQEAEGRGSNKALAMMMKMGFKPGETLGRNDSSAMTESETPGDQPGSIDEGPSPTATGSNAPEHISEPIPIAMWGGKRGVGLGTKRPGAPNPYGPAIKKAKPDNSAKENESAEAFRERTRLEYEEKRAEARLIAATRTCISIDEKNEIQFNILWLNPRNPNTCPPELLEAFARDALTDADADDETILNPLSSAIVRHQSPPTEVDDADGPALSQSSRNKRSDDIANSNAAERLRAQMRHDALQPSVVSEDLGDDFDGPRAFGTQTRADEEDQGDITKEADTLQFTDEEVQEAREFLGLAAPARLEKLLGYLRTRYSYCFWCGTQYESPDDMRESCPGDEEEAHD